MPYATLVERTLPVPRTKVFAALADFGGLDKHLPDVIESITLAGEGIDSLRTIKVKEETGFPGIVVERLETLFDDRVYSYSIVGKSSIPMDNYVAVVRFGNNPDAGCIVRYASNWTPDGLSAAEINGFLEAVYNTICDGIVALHG